MLLLTVFAAAFTAPLFSRILKMPVPVGELIFGLLLGHILGSGQELPEILMFLSEFGFLILMFLAGLEVDFNLIERIETKLLFIYSGYVFSIFIVALILAYILGTGIPTAIILSLISVGLMVATLKDMKMLETPLAKRVLILGVIGEVVSLFALTLMEKVGHFSGWIAIFKELGVVALFFLLFFLAFRLVGLLIWWFPEIVRKLTYEEDPSAIGIRLSLALMFTAAVLAHIAGVESVLGAFLAGMVFSYFIRKKHDLEEKLSSIGYGFLIPIFFIKTGMGMNLTNLDLDLLKEVGQVLLVMLLIRLLPSLLLIPGGFSLKEAFLSSVLLSYPFTLMIAGIEIARLSGLIDERTGVVLFLGAALSSLLFPWGAKAFIKVLR